MKQPLILCLLLGLTLRAATVHGISSSAGLRTVQFSPPMTPQEVIAEVNSLRAEHGIAPYAVNSILMLIAQTQADYMASSGVLSHFDAEGARPSQRAIAAGYPVAGDLSLGGFFSENIAAGVDLSPSELVAGWTEDSLHLNTMISPDLEDVGAGIAFLDGKTYYVLDAAASTGQSLKIVSSPDPGSTATLGTQPAFVVTSTALENGTVYHIVQSNEALWSIALAYDLTVEELKRLNQLTSDDIFIGQKLLIRKIDQSTATLESTITVTLGIPTSTATRPVTPTATFTPTPVPTPPSSRIGGGMVAGSIVAAALLAAALGAWLGRRRPD